MVIWLDFDYYIYMSWIQVIHDIALNNVTSLNIFKLNANFNKFTVGLHYLRNFFILAKFQDD